MLTGHGQTESLHTSGRNVNLCIPTKKLGMKGPQKKLPIQPSYTIHAYTKSTHHKDTWISTCLAVVFTTTKR